MSGVPLLAYLIVAALLFCIGLYATMARRNAIAILMGVELMLNAVNVNLVAFWRFLSPMQNTPSGLQTAMAGQAFTVFVFVVAAAEVAVGLALIISIYRNRRSVVAEDATTLQG
ncbi:MAG: NADH-quinone oxidoreductase subunit NuoK [Anaerolineae bacterium]|nr:NADH-quinone oxidoreductase subunit NuoK [Anaerolineae bacterium]